VPENYDKEFKRALLTFKFQRVYCPKRQKLVMLNEAEGHPMGKEVICLSDTKFLGK
jgi:hypothetical protein